MNDNREFHNLVLLMMLLSKETVDKIQAELSGYIKDNLNDGVPVDSIASRGLMATLDAQKSR